MWTQWIVHAILLLSTCGVLVIGWKRHRQFGFVVLAAWAAVNATWTLGFALSMSHVQTVASWLKTDTITVHMLISLVSNTILSLLLLAGFCLIVFGPARGPSPGDSGTRF
jgi:hypothetical protein